MNCSWAEWPLKCISYVRDFKLAGAYGSISKVCIICQKAKYFPKKFVKNPVVFKFWIQPQCFFTCLYYPIADTGWKRNKNSKEEGLGFLFFSKEKFWAFCFISLKNDSPFHWNDLWNKTCFSVFMHILSTVGKKRCGLQKKLMVLDAFTSHTQLELPQMDCFHCPPKASFKSNQNVLRFSDEP